MNKKELNKLNEAIEHCENVISNLKLKGDCDECLKQHEQLKEWLIELKDLKNIQKYKFEDLKVGMWVWIDKLNTIGLINDFYSGYFIEVGYHEYDVFEGRLCPRKEIFHFGEFDFYPITKAMQYQEEEVKDDE